MVLVEEICIKCCRTNTYITSADEEFDENKKLKSLCQRCGDELYSYLKQYSKINTLDIIRMEMSIMLCLKFKTFNMDGDWKYGGVLNYHHSTYVISVFVLGEITRQLDFLPQESNHCDDDVNDVLLEFFDVPDIDNKF